MTINHPPTLPYKGLTIVLEKPSRFDTRKLISGNAGDYFDAILAPYTRYQCDIRLAIDDRPLLPDTKVILLLGQGALDKYRPATPLLTYRGSPLLTPTNKILLPTITPQDSFDRRNYENSEIEDDEGEEKESEKDYQKTARKNFRFWMHSDVKKAVRLCQRGCETYPIINTFYASPASVIINHLKEIKQGFLTLDIETDVHQNLTCFSFMWSPSLKLEDIKDNQLISYVIPFKRYNGEIFYDKISCCRLFVALSFAISRNTVVGHNLQFDLFVLLYKYYICPPSLVYDTMVAHHRLHPEVEKSLGHCVSYYTDLPYHKDEGVFDPKTCEAESNLWRYNAKDVITTFFIACNQQAHIEKAGARDSVKQACATIRSLLAMQYEGCLCDTTKLCAIVDEADKKMEQYKRILKLLTKRDFNPRSHQQVAFYLYKELRLPCPTKDPTKEDNLLKLYAKFQIPSLRVILAARGEGKQASSLRKIRMWRTDRLTCAYPVTGTNTFRLASRELLSFKATAKHKENAEKTT